MPPTPNTVNRGGELSVLWLGPDEWLVAGPSSRGLLAHGCSLGLHPRTFGTGRCARTTPARTRVVPVARDDLKPGFWVLVRSSCSGHLADRLPDAAAEHTDQPVLPVS